MGNESTTNQSFNRPTAGEFARQRLGTWLRENINSFDSLFRGRETTSHTLADSGKEALNGGNVDNQIISVVNVDDNTGALVHLAGGGNAATILAQDGSAFGTTEGSDGTTNIYWDSSNSQYEINNEKGGERTYYVTYEGE